MSDVGWTWDGELLTWSTHYRGCHIVIKRINFKNNRDPGDRTSWEVAIEGHGEKIAEAGRHQWIDQAQESAKNMALRLENGTFVSRKIRTT